MPDRTCSVASCERPVRACGWCPAHYARWRKYGDVFAKAPRRTYPPARERFWPKVDKNGPIPETRPNLGRCWVWTGCKNPDRPYGRFGVGDGSNRSVLAHRWSYEDEYGPIPEGLDIDHLCRNVSCVRPSHLEAVTHLVNVRRGVSGDRQRAKTHCPQGHEYNEQNTYRFGPGYRSCRACHRERKREKDRQARNSTL